jgi:hypothetical protein
MAGPGDRGESVGLMWPMLVSSDSRHRGPLIDLAVELAAKASGFRRSLPSGVLAGLAELVRAMNCYYSNLIEGYDTHRADIKRALRSDYSADPRKRDLRLEAKAYITVQRWIDAVNLRGRAVTSEALREVHRRFCEFLPEELLWVEKPRTRRRDRVVPGELRPGEVFVGRQLAASPGAVPRFLAEPERACRELGSDRHDPVDGGRASLRRAAPRQGGRHSGPHGPPRAPDRLGADPLPRAGLGPASGAIGALLPHRARLALAAGSVSGGRGVRDAPFETHLHQ